MFEVFKTWQMRVVCLFSLLLSHFGGHLSPALEGAFRATGELRGILTSKSSTWIEVKVDGEATARRFIPSWRGGLPREGGGLDAYVLNKMKDLRTGNRLELHWGYDEYFRVMNVRTIKPLRSRGTVRGIVADKGENWIDVKPSKRPLERFHPRWLGRRPEEGGGLDEKILAAIAETPIGEGVLIEWIYDDRRRVTAFKDLEPEPSEESFVGFETMPQQQFLAPKPVNPGSFQGGARKKLATGLPDPSEFSKPPKLSDEH